MFKFIATIPNGKKFLEGTGKHDSQVTLMQIQVDINMLWTGSKKLGVFEHL